MTVESQETLTFTSEDEREKAINEVPEVNTDENRAKLEGIRNAEIKPDSETEEEPSEPASTQEEETTPEPEAPQPDSEEITPEEGEQFNISKKDLEELGFDSPGKFIKSYKHAQEKITRQGDRIQEDTARFNEELQGLKARLDEVKTPPETPAEEEKRESNITRIEELSSKLQASDDKFSDESVNSLFELTALQTAEIKGMAERIDKAYDNSNNATRTIEEFKKNSEKSDLEKRNEAALKENFMEMDEIGKDYENLKMSKSTKDVEQDWYSWATPIAQQYYGRNPSDLRETHNALSQLSNGNPDLVKKCEDANIALEPNEDVKKYVEICNYINIQNGVKTNPDGSFVVDNNGSIMYHTKWDRNQNKEVPIRFPNLKAAIEHTRVQSGYYKDEKVKAFDQGAASYRKATQKRDSNELDNTHTGKAGTERTAEHILKEIEELPTSYPDEKSKQEGIGKIHNLQKEMEEILSKNAAAGGRQS